MRTVVALALLCTVSAPCLAQELSPNFLKNEPYFLSPWSVVYVDNGSCGVGKVMKVTGALGALRRRAEHRAMMRIGGSQDQTIQISHHMVVASVGPDMRRRARPQAVRSTLTYIAPSFSGEEPRFLIRSSW